MRNKIRLLRFGLVLLLAGVLFLGQGWRVPHPARAAVTKVLRIMPLGDSITAGTDKTYTALLFISYRCELQKLLTTAGYAYDFVGTVHGQWGVNIGHPLLPPPDYCTMTDFDQEGHSGWGVYDILNGAPLPNPSWPGKLSSWAASDNADVVLVHLGTIDLTSGDSVDSTVTGISQIIDTLRAANPFVRIVLAQIIPNTSSNYAKTAVPLFNAQLPNLVASKAQPDSPIVIVDMYTGFPTSELIDGTHPTKDGEARMAGRWKTAIDQIMAINVVLYNTYIPQVVK